MVEMPVSAMLKMVAHANDGELRRQLEFLELTPQQSMILGFLSQNQDLTIYQKDLEEEFALKRPTVTGILRRLADKDLVRCVAPDEDRRFKRIELTDKSRAIHEKMLVHINECDNWLLSALDDEERQAFIKNLTCLYHYVRKQRIKGKD